MDGIHGELAIWALGREQIDVFNSTPDIQRLSLLRSEHSSPDAKTDHRSNAIKYYMGGCKCSNTLWWERNTTSGRYFSIGTWGWKEPPCIYINPKLGDRFNLSMQTRNASRHSREFLVALGKAHVSQSITFICSQYLILQGKAGWGSWGWRILRLSCALKGK